MHTDELEQTVREKVPKIWYLYLKGNELGGDREIRKKGCDKRL